jgi:hypothetical protein
MALTERTIIDKIEIVGDFKHIQCRHATVIERDGVEISRSFHRHVIAPSDDVTGEPLRYKPFALRYTQTPLKQPMLHI